jgi:GH43 family beta-xylosidase
MKRWAVRLRSLALLGTLGVVAGAALVGAQPQPEPAHASVSTFQNPVSFKESGDPQIFHASDGNYYMAWPDNNKLYLYKSASLVDIMRGQMTLAWTAPTGCSGNSCPSQDIWAPEIYNLNGNWYLYFTASDGNGGYHRNYVLENTSSDPTAGSWTLKGKLADPNADYWTEDPSILNLNGSLYFLWSGTDGDTGTSWPGGTTAGGLYIASMSNPYTLSSARTKVSSPSSDEANVNEAPAAIVHGSKVFVAYSAGTFTSGGYHLGYLSASTSANLLSASSWTKTENVFMSTSDTFGPGSNGFTTSPDGTQDWIVYGARDRDPATYGSGASNYRSLRMQQLTWDGSGNPVFGTPAATTSALAVPSGDAGNIISGAPIGKTIFLRSLSNYNAVSTRTDQTNGPVDAMATVASDWEKYQVVDAGGGQIALKSQNNGSYVSAWQSDANTPLETRGATSIGAWEKFTWVRNADETISLMASNGSYVSAWASDTNAPLEARGATSINTWEKFGWGTIVP